MIDAKKFVIGFPVDRHKDIFVLDKHFLKMKLPNIEKTFDCERRYVGINPPVSNSPC